MPTMEWSAPAGCPDASQVRAAVAAMLDRSSRSGAPMQMIARGAVTEADRGFVLRLQVEADGASETKTIEADTCAPLADAYAVIVAFTIDPGARSREEPSEAPGAPLGVSPLNAQQALAGRSAHGVRGIAGPLVAAGAGLLPFPAVGVGARIGIESGLWWELAGTYWPERPASVAVDSATTVGARVSLVSIEPDVCLPAVRAIVAVCVGGDVGVMPAAGTGMARPGSGTSWWLAPTAAIAASVPVARVLNLRFRLAVGVPLLRPSFVAENVGPAGAVQVFQPAAVFGTLGVEAAFQFFSTEPAEARHVGK
jgi:hypothetical protein